MLTILRASSLQPLEIPVVRDRVEIPTITYNPESIDREQYAHIELSSFSATSYIDFLKVIEENALQNTQGIILDLRYNG